MFTYTGEILNHLVKLHPGIKGIPHDLLDNVLSQFADDTAAYLNFDPLTIENFTDTLGIVEDNMGLKVSYEKTTLYRVGSLRNSDARVYTKKEMEWSSGTIHTLGVDFNCDGSPHSSNFDNILTKMDSVCEAWQHRRLSLPGKTLIINSLMGSLFVYKMSVMIELTNNQLNIVNKKIRQFLWGGHKSKIALETLCKKKVQGGLRLVDIAAKQKALQISWIFKTQQDQFLNSCMLRELNTALDHGIWQCNLNKKDCINMFGADALWSRILSSWCELHFCVPTSVNEILHQSLWANSPIRINDKPIIWKHWIDKNIMRISDFLDDNGTMIFNDCNWLEREQLRKAIPKEWYAILTNQDIAESENVESLFDKLSKVKNVTKTVYEMLINDEFAMLKYANR